MYDDRSLVGVGGWLAFFVIILAVLTPLRVLATLGMDLYGDPAVASFYADSWGAIQAFEWSMAILTIGSGWFLAWRLMKVETWQTVRLVIAGIWLLSVGVTIVELLGVSLIGGLPIDKMVVGLGAELVRPFIFSALWTAYFLRSRRVANTYLRDPDESDVAEIFG